MTRRRLIYFSAIVVLVAGVATVWGQARLSKLEGWKPYTPSRLDWLAVDLNASGRIQLTNNNGYLLSYVPIANEDTILIYVKYMRDVNREAMNISIDSARKVIKMKAKSYGWDNWLKVREKIELAH